MSHFYGPSESSWEDLHRRLNRLLLRGLDEKHVTFAMEGAPPQEQIQALFTAESASVSTIENHVIALAREYRDEGAEDLTPEARHFLRERARYVSPVVEAMTSQADQAWRPARLFVIQRSPSLLEQQTLWALITYWEEFGRKRWQNETLGWYAVARRDWGEWRK